MRQGEKLWIETVENYSTKFKMGLTYDRKKELA